MSAPTQIVRGVGLASAAAIFGATAPLLQKATAGIGSLATGGTLSERHGHSHRHEATEHEHLHTHDDEHHHHDPMPRGPHSHPHRHAPVTHDHEHSEDLHHRHPH